MWKPKPKEWGTEAFFAFSITLISTLPISRLAHAEMPYLQMKGVHELLDPKYEYLSPLYGFTLYRQGLLKNLRLYGNYGEYKNSSIPCLEEVPRAHKVFKDNRDCPNDFTSALIQQLFPSSDKTGLSINQFQDSPVSHFSSSLIGKMVARIAYFDVSEWADLSQKRISQEMYDLILNELNPALYWLGKMRETDALIKQKQTSIAQCRDCAEQKKAVSVEINGLKKKSQNMKAYLNRLGTQDNAGGSGKRWAPKDFKPFVDSLIGALLESRKPPTHYTFHTPEQLLLAFFWAKAYEKKDFISLLQQMPRFALSSRGQSVIKDRGDRGEFLRKSYSVQEYQEWTRGLNGAKIKAEISGLLANPERASFLAFSYEMLDKKQRNAEQPSHLGELREKFTWRIAFGEAVAHELNLHGDLYPFFSSALPWYIKDKSFSLISSGALLRSRANDAFRLILSLPLQFNEARLFAIERIFENFPKADQFYITISKKLISLLAKEDLRTQSRILNSALKNNVQFRDSLSNRYFDRYKFVRERREAVLLCLANGYLDLLKELENRKVPINVSDENRNLPLHLAAISGKWEIVEYLAAKNSQDIAVKNKNGNTPLQLTTLSARWDMVRALAGRNPNAISVKGPYGETPLHLAALAGKWELAVYMAELNPQTLSLKNELGNTPLHLAATNEKWDILQTFAEKHLPAISVKNDTSNTPLYLAATSEKWELVKYLAQASPKTVFTRNNNGNTALHEAVIKGNLEVTQFLIGQGSEALSVKNNNGETPLHLAISNGKWNLAKYLAEENKGIILEKDVVGSSPLHEAVNKGNLDMVQFLAEMNLDATTAKNKEGNTPLHEAAAKGKVAIVALLVSKNFETIYAKNLLGETPILVAAMNRNWDAVRALAEDLKDHPEKLIEKNRSEETVLDLAEAAGNTEIVKYLKSIGVDQ